MVESNAKPLMTLLGLITTKSCEKGCPIRISYIQEHPPTMPSQIAYIHSHHPLSSPIDSMLKLPITSTAVSSPKTSLNLLCSATNR